MATLKIILEWIALILVNITLIKFASERIFTRDLFRSIRRKFSRKNSTKSRFDAAFSRIAALENSDFSNYESSEKFLKLKKRVELLENTIEELSKK